MSAFKCYLNALLILLAACGRGHDRAEELAACSFLSKSADSLARCLIVDHAWRTDSAAAARTAWKWERDSLRALHDSEAATVVAVAVNQQEVALRRTADSLWGEWSWQLERDLRLEGYEPQSIRTFLQRIHKHRYEPNVIDLVSNGRDALVNLIEARYDTLPKCPSQVATAMDPMVGTRGQLIRAQAIVCEHP